MSCSKHTWCFCCCCCSCCCWQCLPVKSGCTPTCPKSRSGPRSGAESPKWERPAPGPPLQGGGNEKEKNKKTKHARRRRRENKTGGQVPAGPLGAPSLGGKHVGVVVPHKGAPVVAHALREDLAALGEVPDGVVRPRRVEDVDQLGTVANLAVAVRVVRSLRATSPQVQTVRQGDQEKNEFQQ